MLSKQFGGKVTKELKKQYELSPNWRDGSFKNLTQTQTGIDWRQFHKILYKQIKGHKQGLPTVDLPVVHFDVNHFLEEDAKAKFVWFGHSVVLARIHQRTILIDPMFGPDASPIAPVTTKRFSSSTLEVIDQLPEIDLVLITHDHYDHLDYASINKLKNKVKHFYVALGAKRHLVSWGIDSNKIEEFDWWDSKSFQGIEITFTPTRHFSGRGVNSMAKCLWGGWVFKSSAENIWFSGDGGYGEHFKQIGERLGPFDFALMECGQYCPDWAEIHMFPEESVIAAKEAQAKVVMPIHWGGFNLSYHHAWHEPVEAFARHATSHSLPCLTPRIGEIFQAHSRTESWWKEWK